MRQKNWMPSRRDEQLTMAQNWRQLMGENLNLWDIKQTVVTKFGTTVAAVETELAVPASSRNAVTNAKLRAAFNELVAAMRDTKKRYFLTPPLTDIDYIALGLRPKDSVPTNVPPPSLFVDAELFFPGQAVVEVRNIRPLDSAAADISAYGVRIYYGVIGASDETDKFRLTQRPKIGNDLPHSVFTRRRSHRFDFSGNSGREVFFCLRYENSKGETGPWGALLSAFIP